MCSPVQGPAGKTTTQVAGASGGGDVAGATGGGDVLASIAPALQGIMDALTALIEKLGSLGLSNAVAGATGGAETSGGGAADAEAGVEQMGGCPHMKGKGEDMPAYIPPAKVGGEKGGPEQKGEPEQKGKVAGEKGDGEVGGRHKHRRGRGHHFAPGLGHRKHDHGDAPTQSPVQGPAPKKDSDVDGAKGGPVQKGDVAQDSDVDGAKGDGDVDQTPPAKGDVAQDSDVAGASGAPAKGDVAQDSDVDGAKGDGDVDQTPPAKGDDVSQDSDVDGAAGKGDDVSQDDAPAKGDDVSQDSDVDGAAGKGDDVSQDDAPAKGDDVSQDDSSVAGESGKGDEVTQSDSDVDGKAGEGDDVVQGAGGKDDVVEAPPVKNVGDVTLTESDGSNELWLRAADGSFLQFGERNVTYVSSTGRPTYASLPAEGVAIELSDGTRVSIGMVQEGEWNERAGTPRDIEIISADAADFVAARTDDAENTYNEATPLTAYHLIEIASVLANGEYAKFGEDPSQVVQQN